MSNSSIWLINRALLGTTTPSQSGPGSDDNKEVLRIPQISKAAASPSNGLMSYQDTRYSTTWAEWAESRQVFQEHCKKINKSDDLITSRKVWNRKRIPFIVRRIEQKIWDRKE